jgi:hypothetical protein
MADGNREIESIIDEGAIWQGTQKVSEVLALFRARYTPKAGSPIIDSGDPQDDDSQGRRVDIGAIDLDGHDLDKLGTLGTNGMSATPPGGGAGARGARGGGGSGGGNVGGAGSQADAGKPKGDVDSGTSGSSAAGVHTDAGGSKAQAAGGAKSGCACNSVGVRTATRSPTSLLVVIASVFCWRRVRPLPTRRLKV